MPESRRQRKKVQKAKNTIAAAVTEVYQQTQHSGDHGPEELVFDAADPEDKLIIFSDMHRGARNRADDFRHSEAAYNAALAYYYAMGHTLVVLGDAEELWQEQPQAITAAYRHSLQLEAQFHLENRYIRIWGNHDDAWQHPEKVRRHLSDIFGDSLKVHEAVRIRIVNGDDFLGHLLLIHGHQGTIEGDRFGRLARFFVQTLYRPFQRLTGFSHTTPAVSWKLRAGHNRALFEWVQQHPDLLLIAGHTHEPIFESQTHPEQIVDEMATVHSQLEQDSGNPDLHLRLSELSAELEWIRARQHTAGDAVATSSEAHSSPRYFNTGCCCYTDGQITGIELVNGAVQLIRWPDKEGNPKPEILAPKGDRRTTLLSLFGNRTSV
ncbi:MAG: hypothetical protein ACOC0D_04235 [Spirochaeta sp.]